jgi:hypothetical protein
MVLPFFRWGATIFRSRSMVLPLWQVVLPFWQVRFQAGPRRFTRSTGSTRKAICVGRLAA